MAPYCDQALSKRGLLDAQNFQLEERTIKIFERIPREDYLPGISVAGWFTWSKESCDLLRALTDVADSLPEPVLLHFGPGEYDYTLDLPSHLVFSPALRARLEIFGSALYSLTISSSLTLLTNLLPSGISAHALRLLFASSRSTIVRLTGDPRSAIFAPLGVTGVTAQTGFPLHADLYPPIFLLNIFDNVPDDDSGASLFLSADRFVETVQSIRSIPPHIKCAMLECLEHPTNEDQYTCFYDLLHGFHPWTRKLERMMKAQAHVVRFCHGEGYLLHDRQWLHGRTKPTGGVPNDRLYRLVFNNGKPLRSAEVCRDWPDAD